MFEKVAFTLFEMVAGPDSTVKLTGSVDVAVALNTRWFVMNWSAIAGNVIC